MELHRFLIFFIKVLSSIRTLFSVVFSLHNLVLGSFFWDDDEFIFIHQCFQNSTLSMISFSVIRKNYRGLGLASRKVGFIKWKSTIMNLFWIIQFVANALDVGLQEDVYWFFESWTGWFWCCEHSNIKILMLWILK